MDFVQFYKPDVLAITETWYSEDNPDPVINGDSVFRSYRKETVHGGSMLIISNLYHVTVVGTFSFDLIQTLCCDVCCGVVKIRLICVYRSGASLQAANLLFFDTLLELFNGDCEIILMGDFNFPNYLQASILGDTLESLFNNLITTGGLINFVTQPTCGPNLLDLVFCTDQFLPFDVEVKPGFSTSDHDSVHFKLNLPLNAHSPKMTKHTKNYRKCDVAGIESALSIIDWRHVLSSCSNVNEMWTMFKGVLHNLIDIFVPNVTDGDEKCCEFDTSFFLDTNTHHRVSLIRYIELSMMHTCVRNVTQMICCLLMPINVLQMICGGL